MVKPVNESLSMATQSQWLEILQNKFYKNKLHKWLGEHFKCGSFWWWVLNCKQNDVDYILMRFKVYMTWYWAAKYPWRAYLYKYNDEASYWWRLGLIS